MPPTPTPAPAPPAPPAPLAVDAALVLEIARAPELSDTAVRIYVLLASMLTDRGARLACPVALGRVIGKSRDRVRLALDELEAAGLIQRGAPRARRQRTYRLAPRGAALAGRAA